MWRTILQNLFKKRTAEKLEQAAKKFIAGIMIVMSVFYGTLYYALITLASEDDNVPKPLVSQIGDPASNPQKYYLESIENRVDKIDGLTSESHDSYKKFIINGRKIIEPPPLTIKNKLYVPFRLLIASGSNDYEVEFKSKKGTQKISLAGDKFEYSIFEKQADALTNSAHESNKKKGFLKLATVKPEFQVKHYKPVEIQTPLPVVPTTSPSFDTPTPQPSLEASASEAEPTSTPIPELTPSPTPEPTPAPTPEPVISPQSFWRGFIYETQADEIAPLPDWQNILLPNPVSTSWSIYNNFIEIKRASNFVFEEKNYNAWLKIKLGFDGSDYINFWDFGVSGEENITPDIEFKIRLGADLAGKINRKANENGDLEVEIEKRGDDLAIDVFDLEESLDDESDRSNQEDATVPEITPEPIIEESASPIPIPSVSPTPTPAAPIEVETSPAPIKSEATESPTATLEPALNVEPTATPHFDITPPPTPTATEEQGTPVETMSPEPMLEPTPASTPEPTQAKPSPTSLLNELLGISTANAEETLEQSAAESPSPTNPPPIIGEESDNLVVEPLSENAGAGSLETQQSLSKMLEADNLVAQPLSEEEASEGSTLEITPDPNPIIEGAPGVVNQIIENLAGFVGGASISLPSLEPETGYGAAPITIFEEPITASVDLSEPSQEPQPLLAQIANALNTFNIFSSAATVTSKLNFGLGEEGGVNLQIDENANTITTEITLKSKTALSQVKPAQETDFMAQSPSDNTTATDSATRTVLARTVLVRISDIGVQTEKTGIWVASGDGSKSTDFKMRFNPNYGGAVDQLYLGTDFTTNKVAKPQAGSGGLTLLEQNEFSQAQTKSSTLELLEQSKVRVVVRNIFSLGHKGKPDVDIEERWSIYATGRIIKQIIFDKLKTGEEKWYLNAAKSGFDLPAGYNYNQFVLNTKIEPNSKDLMLIWQNPSSLTSTSFEANETDDSFITVAKLIRDPWTYTEYQMIDLMQEDLSMVDKTVIDERTADYRNPDKPEFALGRFIQVNKQYNSYEMESAANQNRVIFTLDGSQTPRFQPVFEIHDWENPDLNAVKAFLNQKNMVENRDYIVDFRNGDPMTGILVFHFLGTLRANSEFSADGFGVFDIDPEVAPGGGILVYDDGGGVSQSTITTDSTGNLFGAFASVSPQGTLEAKIWVVNQADPVGSFLASGSDNERLVGTLNGSGVLELLRWDGTVWALDWTERNIGSQGFDNLAYDIAYENSGEAVAAWSQTNDTTGLLEYRVWNGVSWGASTSFSLPTTQKISWIEMASHPASGSNQNEIGLCYATGGPTASTGTEVGCAIWNGTNNSWGNAQLMESNAEEYLTQAGTDKTFADFYEQSSNKFVAIWGPEHPGNQNTTDPEIAYATWDGSSWTATAGFDYADLLADGASTIVCAPAPFSLNGTTTKNKAMCATHHNGVNDVNSFIWSASAPGNLNLNTEITSIQALGGMTVAPAWLIDSRAMAVMVFGSGDGTALDYDYWDDTAAAWTVDQTFTHATGTDARYTGISNPNQKNTALFFLIDGNRDLFAYEASVSGTTVTFAAMNSGNAITLDGLTKGLPGMAYDLFPNPTQTHYQWLNDSGALNSGTAAASQDTALTGLTNGAIKRLRVQISNEGAASKSSNFQLEFAKKGTGCTESTLSAGWRYREIHTDTVTASDAFDIELTANFANGDATTASLSASDPTFVAGQGIESASSTSAITLNGNNYTDIEYSLQANTNAQSTTDYCFRLTDGGASTSFTYTKYGEVQTGTIGAAAPTYTQDYFRFYVNVDNISPTDPWPSSGGADLAENATMSAHFASVASGSIARLRTNVLVSTATLDAASQTFQLQYAQGFKCGAIAGGSWAAVGASTSDTIWRFGSNAGVTDGTALPDAGTLLSNSTNAARATYEENNPSAVNPNAVTSGQRMEHDWSLQNNGAVSGASYCFRIIRPSGTTFETYNYFPLAVLGPSADQVLRHGAFFSEGYEQGYYWSGI